MEALPDTAPQAAQLPQRSGEKHPSSTRELLASLQHLRDSNPKAVRATVHHYPASLYAKNGESSHAAVARDRRITSWKMTEHMYFNANNPFPTMARGLFTEELEDCDEAPSETSRADLEWDAAEEIGRRHRIVARGYDKFFNIDEVGWTNVSRPFIFSAGNRLTLRQVVGGHADSYAAALSPNTQIQRLSDPHRRVVTISFGCRLKTLSWYDYRS